MKLIDIAVSSLKRQLSKRIFLIISIILGCGTVISLFTFVETQKANIEKQFDEYGANILILPKSDNLSLTYGGVNVSGVTANIQEITLEEVNKIWEIPNKQNIRAVSPKLIAVANFDEHFYEQQVLLIGIMFEEERKIKTWWEIDGQFPQTNNELLIGSEVALKLDLQKDDTISIAGSDLIVAGVLLPTGSQDDTIIFADYDFVAKKFNKEGQVSLVEASALCSDCPIETITEQISTNMPNAAVNAVRQVMAQKMNAVNQFERFAFTITSVIGCIGAILIFTSMMGAVAERKHEIGIFRAIGYKKRHIISIILTESSILSLIAAVIGVLGGIIITSIVLPKMAEMETSTWHVEYLLAVIVFFSTILISLLATIYPAYKASRVDPVATLNSI